ncbi:hypothetical protein CDL15_Pgr017470 [Punica granatum]|uniref:valine--tRNA ligase n=1 Tax=Punica granatum TaxID=22663 RepID=A0A218W5G1_PUNGR|nr:hypothetical protein CDL15_Pgr017470 [Punica granatum]
MRPTTPSHLHPSLPPSPAPRRIPEYSSVVFVSYERQLHLDHNVKNVRRKGDRRSLHPLRCIGQSKRSEAVERKQEEAPQEVGNAFLKKNVKKDRGEERPDDCIDPETPPGEKKRLSKSMRRRYDPKFVEKSWYEWWEKSQFFVADANSSKPPFVIVLPCPNVTGALHIGHALTTAIEDTIIRWKRMSGYNALWVPGIDHAGIATQVVVEKKLMRERHLTRHDVGREEFIAEVRKWKEEYGGTILKQERRLGASLDWSREFFTMDEKRSRAVTEAFVRLHDDGLIYRDIRLVNWDFTLRSAISEIEVNYVDIKGRTLLPVLGWNHPVEFGVLVFFAYKIEKPPEEGLQEIVVATTRVETMLGDAAIAVHPDDERYKKLHGKYAMHPFIERRIPIICDEILVDPSFGSGAVKITLAHDPNDFEVGKRHNLEFINIFTDDGKININGGSEFVDMLRFEARQAVIEALKTMGLYRFAEDHEMQIGLSSRTNDVIEPLIKPQWWVNCEITAKEALDTVMDEDHRKLEIIPKQHVPKWKKV